MGVKLKAIILFMLMSLSVEYDVHAKTDVLLHFPFLTIPAQEIIDNPITCVSGVGLLLTLGYVSQDYWLNPMLQYVKKMSANQARDCRKDDNGISDFAKTKARIYKPGEIKITLDDVAGAHGAKLDVQDVIHFLKNPEKYTNMGATIPKGILLQGPPGTGKTLLAKALAGQANVPFLSVCASEFSDIYVGVGSARLRDLFAKAKELAPCIIFFDEFDAIGTKRSSSGMSGSDDHAQTIAQLLTLMDGFETQENPIIMIAATNRAQVLDPALLRPGRFDRIVAIDLPYLHDRIEILKVHAQKIKASRYLDFSLIARATMGFSGAELAHLINEAAILAVNEDAICVEMVHIDQAYDNITLGRETQGMEQIDEDMWQTAIHEAGHSIIRVFLDHAHPLYKVTITPRGGALGISYSLPLREKYSKNEEEMKAQIIVCLAGGLAEQAFNFGKTAGLSSDLRMARKIAYDMVVSYGMSERLRYISYADIDDMLPNDIATQVHQEVNKIIDECYEIAQSMVLQYRDKIEQLADLLMQQGTVFGNIVYNLCDVPEPKIEYGLNR
jgi:cell division protease FtsH